MAGFIKLGRYGFATRDCPNVIVPTLANTVSQFPGESWTWPSYLQVVASLAYPFLLEQAILCLQVGTEISTNVSTIIAAIFQHEVATGAESSEATVATTVDGMGILGTVSGIVPGDSILGVFRTLAVKDVPIGPVVIPASTRIAWRSVMDTTATARGVRLCLSGYNLTNLDFATHAAYDEFFYHGLRPLLPKPMISLGSTAVAAPVATWTLGASVSVVASLDADYLIQAIAMKPTSSSFGAGQFAIDLGGVVQAWGALPITTSTSLSGAGIHRFRHPFIAYKGEALNVTVASARTVCGYLVEILGVRLN